MYCVKRLADYGYSMRAMNVLVRVGVTLSIIVGLRQAALHTAIVIIVGLRQAALHTAIVIIVGLRQAALHTTIVIMS